MLNNNNKSFKILSIDGGGIKGLYSLYMLKSFEDEFCIPNNKRIIDYFDMICGTSTGGIIALGLAYGISLDKIIKIYEDKSELLFPYHNSPYYLKPFFTINQIFWTSMGCKYNNNVMYDMSKELFNDATLGDLKKIVCIPSYCINTGLTTVFKTPHPEFLKEIKNPMDKRVKLIDVVLSTSSAPTYFPIHKIMDTDRSGYYIDGGVWANNPSMIGITEALRFFVGKNKSYDNYSLLSIGNIQQNKSLFPTHKYFWNLSNLPNLISTFFDGNTQAIHQWSFEISKFTNSNYVRINANDFNLNSLTNIKLDDANKNTIENIKSNAKSYALRLIMKDSDECNKKNIHQFFKDTSSYVF
jgi:patatin-like phospholipase/acyl hydrolase